MRIDGGLLCEDCTSLTSLPKNFNTNYRIDFDGCTDLEILPEGLTLLPGGNLYLSQTKIKVLPASIFGKNGMSEIHLSNCTTIQTLPDNLHLAVLAVDGCTGLKGLPNNLSVSMLNINHTVFPTVPDDLRVSGSLYMAYSKVQSLPLNAKKIHIVSLEGCTSLVDHLDKNIIYSSIAIKKDRIACHLDFEVYRWCRENDIKVTEKLFNKPAVKIFSKQITKPLKTKGYVIKDNSQMMLYRLKWQ